MLLVEKDGCLNKCETRKCNTVFVLGVFCVYIYMYICIYIYKKKTNTLMFGVLLSDSLCFPVYMNIFKNTFCYLGENIEQLEQ